MNIRVIREGWFAPFLIKIGWYTWVRKCGILKISLEYGKSIKVCWNPEPGPLRSLFSCMPFLKEASHSKAWNRMQLVGKGNIPGEIREDRFLSTSLFQAYAWRLRPLSREQLVMLKNEWPTSNPVQVLIFQLSRDWGTMVRPSNVINILSFIEFLYFVLFCSVWVPIMCQTHVWPEETMAINISPCLYGADVLVGETENNQVKYD